MRVLQVINSIAPSRGGPTYVVLHLARALAARGLEVRILSTRADLDEAGEAEARQVAGGGVEIVLREAVGPRRLELSPGLVGPALRMVRRAEVVHAHTVFTFPVAVVPAICRGLSVPHVVRPAGTLDADCLRNRSERSKRLALSAYVRANLLGADAVQATSEREASELLALAPGARVRVVEPGALDEVEAAVPPDAGGRGRRVGYLGRLHPIKRLEVLVRAVARLPEVELRLAGTGADPTYVEGLRSLAASLGLGERVRFVGQVDEAGRGRFFAGCELMAFPSSHENFGVAVAQSMAAGRAVLVSPEVSLADEIAREGAGRVEPAEPARWAEAMAALLSDGAARAEMAARGRALSERRFGWAAAAERTVRLYEEVLERASPPDLPPVPARRRSAT